MEGEGELTRVNFGDNLRRSVKADVEHRSGRLMDTAFWEPTLWMPWDHHFYVVCTCGYRYDDKDKWAIYPTWAEHIMGGSNGRAD